MAICQETKRWITEKVQVPVEKAVTQLQTACTEYKKKIEQSVRKPVEQWVARQERKCKKRKWYDPRRWLCTLVNILVKVITWIVVIVVTYVPYFICKVVSVVVKVIVKVVIRVLKFAGVFLVCLFTDPLEALKSLWDLWNDLVDVFEDLLNDLKSFLEDATDLLTDAERLTDSAACSLGPGGLFFIGTVGKFIGSRGREGNDIVYDALRNLDLVLEGILRLNYCQVLAGLGGLVPGDLAKIIAWALGIPAGLGGSARDALNHDELEKLIESALTDATNDEKLREKARQKIGLGNCPFGLQFTVIPCRFYLSSRSKKLDLKQLHDRGIIDLYAASGLISGCGGVGLGADSFEDFRNGFSNAPARWQVVYAGTNAPVSHSDLGRYLSEGPSSVPEFRVYPIRYDVFERYLKLAKRKGYSIGIDLFWKRILDIEWAPVLPDNNSQQSISAPDSGVGQAVLFTTFGPSVGRGDICDLPAFAVFRYYDTVANAVNPRRSGYTSMFPSVVSETLQSGVTFRDKLPEFFFRWVLIHEMGHYFSLEHAGHDGLHNIMWTPDPNAGLDWWTGETTAALFLDGLEPRFTRDDAYRVWRWIITNARVCLFDEQPVGGPRIT